MNNPTTDGRYLACVYEWVGMDKDKPAEPRWVIKRFEKGEWEREKYYFDTGFYETLEVIEWQDLPKLPTLLT